MKKLVLYFLFFVAAALILVQCAKFFPSDNKPPAHLSGDGEKTNASGNVISKNSVPKSASEFSAPSENQGTGIRLLAKQPSFTLNMVDYISGYEFLSYQYWDVYHNAIKSRRLFHYSLDSFLFRGLWTNNRGGLMATNEAAFNR